MAQSPIQKFLEQIKNLPEDLEQAILSVDFLKELKKIQQDKRLHIDQAAALEETTLKAMLGEIEINDFVKTLAANMRVSEQEAAQSAQLIEKNIFGPIRASFEQIQEELVEEEVDDEILTGNNVQEPTVKTISDESVHEHLHVDDVLAGIENPHPSVPEVHETIIPGPKTSVSASSAPTGTSSSATVAAAQKLAATPPPAVQAAPKVATADILANATKQFPSNPLQAAGAIQQANRGPVTASVSPSTASSATLGMSPSAQPSIPSTKPAPAMPTAPAASPIQQVATALNNNLSTPTVNKPEQVKSSLDPYRELV